MDHPLVAAMCQFTTLSADEAAGIVRAYPLRQLEAGEYLLREGQVARAAYLLVDGCIRKYVVSERAELTLDFFLPGDTVANLASLGQEQPSTYAFVCVTATTLAVVDPREEDKLYREFPRFERICRVEFQNMMGDKEAAAERYAALSLDEKYLYLLAEKPALFQLVPQHQIASYLGIQPETLSRIRKRLARQASTLS